MSYRSWGRTLKTLTLSTFATFVFMSALAREARAEDEKNKSAGYLYAAGPHQEKIILPLKKTQVHLEITGGIIRAEVKQTFQNTSPYPLEAIYTFPLPSQATVTDLALTFKNKIIKSVVKEKEEAKQIYEKAKDEGKKTALLEEDRPNIFTTSVANFLPGETVEVSLNYLEPATFHDGRYEILFPTVVGPRYIPLSQLQNDEGVKDARSISPPLLPEGVAMDHQLEIAVTVEGIPYEKIVSPTHDIAFKSEGKEKAEISLAKKEVPNRDFVLKIFVKSEEKPLLSLIQSQSKKQYYGLVHLFPQKNPESAAAVPREVVFLIDTSGSMMGQSILQAQSSLKACLKMLKSVDTFNIVRFSTGFSSFDTSSRPASEANLASALQYVDSLKADGGTEMQPALRHVLNLPSDPNKMRLIIFLTDGDVGNEKELMQLLQQDLGKTRIFPFGIGSAPNEYLLRKLGELGKGVTHFIHDATEVQQTITELLATLGTPLLTDVQIRWEDRQGKEIQNIKTYPKLIPDLFADRPLEIVAQYAQPLQGKMVVKGMMNGKAVEYDYPFETADQSDSTGIKTFWGRAWVEELLYEYNFPRPTTDTEILKKKIIEVAFDYQLITPFTSRVAVEQKISRKPNGEIVTVDVPTLLPEGWDRRGLESTATLDPLLFLLALVCWMFAAVVWLRHKRRNTFPVRGGGFGHV